MRKDDDGEREDGDERCDDEDEFEDTRMRMM